MTEQDKGDSPKEENLGKSCMYWHWGGKQPGCHYPKADVEGRLSCEGTIDDVCLFLLWNRPPTSLTEEQQVELKSRRPSIEYNKTMIPPGDIS